MTFDPRDQEMLEAMKRVNARFKTTLQRLAQSEKEERMTLPYEEVRSLQAVRRFLYDLLDPSVTPRVPKAIRQRAHRLSKHYPMDFSITERYPDVFNKEIPVTTTETTRIPNHLAVLAEQYLSAGETVTVVFTKKDGTERTMHCTRNMNAIPQDKHPKGAGRQKSQWTMVVFDIEKGEWRSFDEGSVLSVQRGSMIHQ